MLKSTDNGIWLFCDAWNDVDGPALNGNGAGSDGQRIWRAKAEPQWRAVWWYGAFREVKQKQNSLLWLEVLLRMECLDQVGVSRGRQAGLAHPKKLFWSSRRLRTNLWRNSLLHPQLRTNEQGEVSFSFTMPESLTRWNFRGLLSYQRYADGHTGRWSHYKQRNLCWLPNLPRFVRAGDETSVAASISTWPESRRPVKWWAWFSLIRWRKR